MIDWKKILANAGFAFASTLAGLITYEGLVPPYIEAIVPALMVAGIQGLVAFFLCLKDDKTEPTSGVCQKKGLCRLLLLF